MLALNHGVSVLQGHQVMIATDNRQQDSCSLYQQTGWDPFPHPVASGSGSVSMATDSRYSHLGQTHSGLPKCDSRPVILAKKAHHDRVASPPRNSEPDIRDVGNSCSGHVYHSPQHASSPVYISSSGALSTGSRCSVTRLAGEVHVHVSTVSPVQQSHLEAQDQLGMLSNTKSPLVAITTVVSTPTTPVCGPPLILSIPPRLTVTRGICLERQVIPSACIEALMQHYQAAGFSKEVSRLAAAPRRSSTNKMYDDKLRRFAHWATGQGFDLFGPTAAGIAAFLYDLFDTRGLSPQTVEGYRFCLASVLSRTGKAAAVQAKAISDMIMSMELQRPTLTPVLPQWDLGIVLEALSEPPYEPLREASLRHLTLKTVFLLSMASAGRCSELQALVFDTQYIQFKPKGAGVTLCFTPEFMRKNQSQVSDPWILVFLVAQLERSVTITDK